MESSTKLPQETAENSSIISSTSCNPVSCCDLPSDHKQARLAEESENAIHSLLSMSYDVIKTHSDHSPYPQQTRPEHTLASKNYTEQHSEPLAIEEKEIARRSDVTIKKKVMDSGIAEDVDQMKAYHEGASPPVKIASDAHDISQTEVHKSTQHAPGVLPLGSSGIRTVLEHTDSGTNVQVSHSTSSATVTFPKSSTLVEKAIKGEMSTKLDSHGSAMSDEPTPKHDVGVQSGAKPESSASCSGEGDNVKPECSFTDSDDTNSHNEEDSKKGPDGFFQLMFDIDEASKSSVASPSDPGTFLTCSVCGKELPETAEPDGGKEVCNTCKMVRMDSDDLKTKKRAKRKRKAAEKHHKKEPLGAPKEVTSFIIDKDIVESLVPVRKSGRKRVSTISVKDLVQDSDDSEPYLLPPVDDVSDEDFIDTTSSKRKVHIGDKKSRKSNPHPKSKSEESTKSKYAERLNLTPVVRVDPDKAEDSASAEPTQEKSEAAAVPVFTEVKKKGKGRPKGSKNKSVNPKKAFKEAIKEARRDVSFNKRWHRAHGPVPDSNPDSIDGLWSCEFCMKTFSIRRNFLAHRRKHSGRHNCTECDETFECNSKLQRHIRRHRGEKPFACHLCSKAYSENMWLQRHLAVHLAEGHSPLPKPYQCNICGRQYTHKGTMIYHVKTHTETKFYQCDVCGKQFTHRSSLECHIKTHTGEKPYVCEICGKRFADRSVQLRHTRSHSGDKPYKCTVCDKGFTQSGTLNIHMRLHSSEKPYKCKLCDMGFLKRSELSKHSKTHLGELLSNNINLITCRVTENKGDDIQKKAAQILIDAYGEKRADGSIEIKTRQFEHSEERFPIQQKGAEIYSRQGEVPLINPQHLLIKNNVVHLTHEEIQRRALEFIAMKRRELEQMTIAEGMPVVQPPVDRPVSQTCSAEEQVVEHHHVEVGLEHQHTVIVVVPELHQPVEVVSEHHQPVEVVSEHHQPVESEHHQPTMESEQRVVLIDEYQPVEMVPELPQHMDPSTVVAQQIKRHVEEHVVERQLLEQVEGQLVDHGQGEGRVISQELWEGHVISQEQVEGKVIIQDQMEGRVITQEQVEERVVGQDQMEGRVISQEQVEGRVISQEQVEGQIIGQEQMEGRVISQEQVEDRVISQEQVEGRVITQEQMGGRVIIQEQVEGQVIGQEQGKEIESSQGTIWVCKYA